MPKSNTARKFLKGFISFFSLSGLVKKHLTVVVVVVFSFVRSFVILNSYKKVQSLPIWRHTFCGWQTNRKWRKIGKIKFKSVETKRIFIARAMYWILAFLITELNPTVFFALFFMLRRLYRISLQWITWTVLCTLNRVCVVIFSMIEKLTPIQINQTFLATLFLNFTGWIAV